MFRSPLARAGIAVSTATAMLAAMVGATPAAAIAPPAPSVFGAPPAVGPADAVLTVNSTGDATDLVPGNGSCDTGSLNVDAAVECTLRAAIVEANAHPADMAITFAIPVGDPGHTAGVWTIQPATRFESLVDPATIDGSSQPGYLTTPVVHLDGSALTVDLANSGVIVDTPAMGSVVRGLSITGFGNDGLQTRADDVVVEDNYFGVLPDGVTAVGSASEGLIVYGAADGTIVRDNLFGGHPNAAIALNGDTTGSVVQGNRFGTDATGTVIMPNGQAVWSDTTGSALIGGTQAGEGNVLANSDWNAIELHGPTARIAIVGNEIVDSGNLAIDLGSDNSVTANDAGDGDSGTNDLLNFPVLDAAVAAAGTVEIDFTLDAPAADYRVEFFANPSGIDPSGHGEAEQLVGFTEIGHLGGSRSYTAAVPGAVGDALTATTTRLAPGPVPDVTSEMAAAITVTAPTTFTVNATADATDLAPGDAVCDTGAVNSAGAPACTLRAALEEADATPGTSTVRFALPSSEPGFQPAPLAYVIAPASPLPAMSERVVVDGSTQPEFGTEGRPVVQLDGAGAGTTAGLRIAGANSVVRGLSIGNFGGAGVVVSGPDSAVTGNHIGVDPVGSTETPNTGVGVDVNADRVVVGGTNTGDRNVISGNQNTAVSIIGYDDVTVAGNYLGTDAAGLVAMTNGGIYAISVFGDRVRIGGTAGGAGNVIGGYWGGIGLSSGTASVVEGNFIGVGADGTTAIPNVRGISVDGTGQRIGGTAAAARNVIANSTQEGVSLDSGSNSVVQGNYIGTDATGVAPAPNVNGLRIVGGTDHVVGGSAPGAGNLIAHNTQRGVLVTAGTGTRIEGNTIHANGWQAIYASSGAANGLTVGGTAPGEGNTITQSGNIGVVLQVGTYGGISVLGNSIHDNGSIGIDHNWDGVTVNDAGDLDDGPNGLLNHPSITSALEVAGTVSMDLDLDVPAGDYRLEVFTNPSGTDLSGYGEGEVLSHNTTLSHDGSGVLSFTTSFPGSAGDVLTATVTEELAGPTYGSTSEFSPIQTVAAPVAVVVNSTGDGSDVAPGDQSCDTGGLNADGDPECTLRAAIEETNGSGLIDRIEFTIPAADPGLTGGVWTIAPTSPLPWVMSSVTIDASTQPGHVPNGAAALLGSTATMAVVLGGTAAGSTDGLVLQGASATAQGLVINGFDGHGLVLGGPSTLAAGVYIGVSADGSVAVPNAGDGVVMNGDDTQLGGTAPANRVVVSGNGGQGVRVSGANASIRGALIGVDASAVSSIRNGGNGIRLDAADYTTIGEPNAGNVIAGNDSAASTADGVYSTGGGGHIVQANLIGTNTLGAALGNFSAGLAIDDAKATMVGGTGPGERNIIRFNGSAGVAVRGTSDHVAMLFNTISDNGGLGIDHAQDGVTPNDPGDLDSGPNGLLNHPVITQATVNAGILGVDLDLDLPAGDYRVELFANPGGVDPTGYGEGETLRRTLALTHAGTGVEPFSTSFAGNEGDLITATVTQDLPAGWGPTSEFSAWVSAIDVTRVRVNDAGDASDLLPGDGVCDTGGLNSVGAAACTLRAAVQEANASVVDQIEFLIPAADPGWASGVWTIRPASGLPPINSAVTIDATTQPSYVANSNSAPQALNGAPVVELDGSSAGANQDGLVIDASDVTVRGLVINRFDNDGITVLSGADRFTLTGSYLGTTTDGLASTANSDDGVDLGGTDAVVGGTDPAHRNLISGNAGDGIEISLGGSANRVLGNVIGLGSDGVTAVPNGLRGIEIWEGSSGNIIGGTAAGSANLISGNGGDGVRVRGAGTDANTVLGNWIGPDTTGTNGPGNNEGVNIFGGAVGNVIGPGNVISANRADGVYIGNSGTDANRVIGNLIGLTTSGTAALANADRGVQVETGATNNVVGGPDAADRNVISGNGTEGIIIADFTASGTTDNQVTNNFIGTDQSGALPVPNTRDGVRVVASGGNLIGGLSPFDGNLIAHNGQHGVEISGTALADNAITWNRIHSNGGLGVDIGDDGVTPNDAGDLDTGANDMINYPVITSAAGSGGGTSTVAWDFDLEAGDYLFHFHTNAVGADPSGYGEGQSALHVEALAGHPGGAGSLVAAVPVDPGDVITATVTEDLGSSYGSTSEFSAARTVVTVSTDVAPDSSNQRADMAFRGGLSWTTSPGKAGLGQEFDGGAARLVGPPIDIDSGGLTLSTWVQPKSLSGSPRLVAKSDGAGTPVYELLIDTSGSPRARARIELGGTVYEAAGGVVTTGWHHLASTWDGSSLQVYVDGVAVASTPTAGTPTPDPSLPLVVGNTAGATNALEGRLDEVRVANVPRDASWLATSFANQDDAAGFITAGVVQTQAPGAWTVTSTETHTGAYALQAPVTDTIDSWITADGITEPGVEFDTWWWFSDATGDLAQGVRTGATPITQHETALLGPAGWDLGRIDPGGRSQDVAPPGGQAPSVGTWTKVTVRIDQSDRVTVLVGDSVIIGPTSAAAALTDGSVGLRGRLPSGQQWYVDDAVARRLVAVEPVASLAALDR